MSDRMIDARRFAGRAPTLDFVVTGVLGGRTVNARWEAGRLTGDEDLIHLAALAVDAGERYVDPDGNVVAASLDHLSGALLAVCRALDRVVAADLYDA